MDTAYPEKGKDPQFASFSKVSCVNQVGTQVYSCVAGIQISRSPDLRSQISGSPDQVSDLDLEVAGIRVEGLSPA